MNLKLFNVETTNMFPMSNSTKGGQLLTEYNLISKESALTTPSIEYTAGMSFVHSESEFLVTVLSSGLNYLNQGVTNSATTLMISKGRAVVNGYFVESLIDTVIDLAAINSSAETPLTGNLAIGLKTYFSNGGLVDGAIQVEEAVAGSTDMVFGGLQVVIIPADDVRTPRTIIGDDNYGSEALKSSCNMDLLLATFNYTNGNISNIVPNPTRLQCIPGSRIENIDGTLNTTYISKAGLQQYKFYTFAGKGDPTADTWCDSTDSLMVWDEAAPRITTDTPPIGDRARFLQNDYTAYLHIPHKQIDGMKDSYDNPAYYAPVDLGLPVADFSMGTPGVVNKYYTQQVKNIITKINELYTLPDGKQRAFIADFYTKENTNGIENAVTELPPISVMWQPGDYVLVGRDHTFDSDLNDALNLSPPSTLYAVLPPAVTSVGSPIDPLTEQPISRPSGTQLAIKYLDQIQDNIGSSNPLAVNTYWDPLQMYRGRSLTDYFTLSYTSYDENNVATTTEYFYPVASTDGIMVYSDPIQLTGQYPFATTTMTGGFLDVDTADIDNGYVYLDENGHLRLLDYGLLRTGVLAYQLGEDFTMPSGLTYDEMQANLDDYVNERVAFPNASQIANAETNNLDPYVININLNLSKSDETVTLNIKNIDSRFNTAVFINLTGDADSNTVIHIDNCQKVRILSTYGLGGPAIAVTNSCLYYDANILDYISTMRYDTYWYKRYDSVNDPHIIVDGMTIRTTVDTSNALSVENIDYWSSDALNDNHIQVITKSITLSDEGKICGCGVLIRNNITNNVSMGRSMILDTFTLPNIPAILPIPENKFEQPIYVTGEFMVVYPPVSGAEYVCIDTQFTLRTQANGQTGQLAVMLDSYNMGSANLVQIDSWSPNTYHLFEGAANNL